MVSVGSAVLVPARHERQRLGGASPPPWTPFYRRNPVIYSPMEVGQGLVEYALILVLVAIVVIVILSLLGPAIGNVFSQIFNNI